MNDKDIAKLASKLTVSLATKEDLKRLATKEDLKRLATKEDLKRLEKKVNEIDQNTHTLLDYSHELEEATNTLEKRLRVIESIPAIAHEIKGNPRN